jgi:hypothetical protein
MASLTTGIRNTGFGIGVLTALAFGVTSANAAPTATGKTFGCPGYTETAQACTDCCWNWYQAYGFWSPSNKSCNCAL